MKITLITSCSSTRTAQPIAKVEDLPTNLKMGEALVLWKKMLDSQPPSLTPGELYRGAGFYTLAKIQDEHKPESVKIVTGGQGLIDINEKIVPYDFSASPKEEHNITQKVTAEPFVQGVWWRMINQAQERGPTPIANLVRQNDSEVILISLGKIFLRYVSDDILTLEVNERQKVRILLSASSIGSVPAQLRPMIIAFDRECVGHLPGNRNDNNHRAALTYLNLCEDAVDQEDTQFKDLPIEKQRPFFIAASPQSQATSKTDIKTLLTERPHLLKLSPIEAYHLIRREFGTIGGRMYFKGIFRSMQVSKIEVDDVSVAAGLEAMRGMDFTKDQERSNDDEEEVLSALKVFTSALSQFAPDRIFTASDVVKWAPVYFKGMTKSLPAAMETPNKLAYFIKNNTSVLGVKESDKINGGYVLAPTL